MSDDVCRGPSVGAVVPGQGLAPACAAIPHIAEADPGP